MKSQIVLSVLLAGKVSSLKLTQNFATGMNGDEDLGQDIIMKGKPFHYNQEANQALVQLNSRWVELPDCKSPLGEDDVVLNDDLSNATIATCKGQGYIPQLGLRTQRDSLESTYQQQWGTDYKHWIADPVFDPIFYTKQSLQDHEHQIVIHEHKHIDPSAPNAGPAVDFYRYGKPLAGTEWPQPVTERALVQIF